MTTFNTRVTAESRNPPIYNKKTILDSAVI